MADRFHRPAVSSRLDRIAPSATLRISATAKRMRADGVDIIDLSAGEPDFETPSNVKDAAKRAIDSNFTGYTTTAGIPPLRKAVAARLREDHGVEYDPEDIIVSAGAKQCVYNACAVLLDPGDRVVIPSPYWVSYPEIVRLVGAEPVFVPTSESDGFRLRAEGFRPHLAGAKLLIINNPCNPTGATYGRVELEHVVRMALDAGVMILADEIYEKLVYDDADFTSTLRLGSELRDHLILVSGLSKTYAMTGWRVGYAAGPSDVIQAMGVLQGHSTSNVTSISQMAALEALTGPQDAVSRMRRQFDERRRFVLDGVASIPGWSCPTPGGAFYVFINAQSSLALRADGRAIGSDVDLCQYLIERARVAVVPGEAFGAPGYIRISYASAPDRLREGMARIAGAIAELGGA